MKVGINLLYLLPGECGGTETYGICLVNALAALDRENEYVVFLNEESAQIALRLGPNFTVVRCPVRAMSRPRRYFYEQLQLPWLGRRHRLDLLHSLGYVAPILSGTPQVVTVHDMNFVALRKNFGWIKRHVYSGISSLSIHRAQRVITISEFSRQEIHRELGTPLEKISVTLLGPGWLGTVAAAEWADVQRRYALPEQFILAIGGGTPHKNIDLLVEAYQSAPDLHEYPLVLMGKLPSNVRLPEGDRIRVLGYVPVEDIEPLFRHCTLYVLPSLYEGFGLPLIEAQYCGALVASSNAASLPEVGGAGAFYFDPRSTDSITKAMREALHGPAETISLVRRSAEENLRRFSWEKTAQQTRRIYESLVGPAAASQRRVLP